MWDIVKFVGLTNAFLYLYTYLAYIIVCVCVCMSISIAGRDEAENNLSALLAMPPGIAGRGYFRKSLRSRLTGESV